MQRRVAWHFGEPRSLHPIRTRHFLRDESLIASHVRCLHFLSSTFFIHVLACPVTNHFRRLDFKVMILFRAAACLGNNSFSLQSGVLPHCSCSSMMAQSGSEFGAGTGYLSDSGSAGRTMLSPPPLPPPTVVLS